MAGQQDPFYVVKTWWGNRHITSDTQKDGVDPSTGEGAFECLILGILYSVDGDEPAFVKNTLDALRAKSLTKINVLASISDDSNEYRQLGDIWKKHYLGGRYYPAKVNQIIKDAKTILADEYLGGDFRKLYLKFDGNGLKMLNWMWTDLTGIKKKTFLVNREMRMRGVWRVDGQYCCVPDVQVGSSLWRWHKITKWPDYHSFKIYLNCSQIIWAYFSNLYDLPILHYSRHFKCNSSARRCNECEMDETMCKRENPKDAQSSWKNMQRIKSCISCGTTMPIIARYCFICGVQQP